MTTNDPIVLGVDLGGTKTRIALVSRSRGLLNAETRPTPGGHGPEPVLLLIKEMCLSLASYEGGTLQDVRGVGLGAPGPLDRRKGVVSIMPNLPGWEGFPLQARLVETLDIPAAVINDGDAAALGEHRYGAGRGVQNLVYVTLGTGVGGGFIVQGQPYGGAAGAAAEIGHMLLDPNGPICGCGHYGCLEAFSSGSGMERQAARLLADGTPTALAEIVAANGGVLTTRQIETAARQGDATSKQLFKQAALRLAQGLVTLVHLMNPEVVIFGGGLLAIRDLLIDPAVHLAQDRLLQQHLRGLRFNYAQLEEDAGVLGAAALALDAFGQ